MVDPDNKLPELHEAQLDKEQLLDLFSDLELVATVLEVRTKSSSGAHSAVLKQSLGELANELWANEIAAIQVVYTHQGHTWFDTLMRNARGVRVVRMRKESVGPSP